MTRLLLALTGSSGTPGQAQVLYDGAAGTLPNAQGWSYAAFPGTATQSQTGEGARLDTRALLAESAGYARRAPQPLDRAEGFSVAFAFRLRAEQHQRPERAGFSVIVLGADRRGIELGFWQDEVFAQADEPLFTRGESAGYRFDEGLTRAVVSVVGATYSLYADRELVLRGAVRDYTAFSGFPDVYETPDFIFLGDDTTSAAADVELNHVALVFPPVLELEPGGGLRWAGVPGQTYFVESSGDLRSWSTDGAVESVTGDFRWEPVAGMAQRFFRVVHR